MHRSYQRRAFLVVALMALEPASAEMARAADGDTLWDVLSRAPLDTVAPSTPQPAQPVRRPLGPIPGFTLPSPGRNAQDIEAIFAKKSKKRGVLGTFGEWVDRLQKSTGTKVKLKGEGSVSFRAENISGNSDAFRSDRYFGQGNNGIYNQARLDVDATFFNSLHYKTTINNDILNNPNDPNYNRVQLDYGDNSKPLHIQYGDINAGFQGNSLIDFNRYLSGMQITNRWTKQFETQVLFSQTRSDTRTITIQGNGSAGPYYVYAGQIVDGTARVRLNETELTMGRDFTLDQYSGELRFYMPSANANESLSSRTPRVILPTDTIAVTFETIGYNQGSGSIYGIRTKFSPTARTTFGMTYVTQQAKGQNGLQTRTQEFYGYTTPGAAYLLDSPIDPTKPLLVKVGGVPLQQNVEFIVDAKLTNQIRILQGVPPTVIVSVTYVPLNVNPVPGNRNVLGLDSRVSLGKLGDLTAEMALSGLSLQGNDIGGHAWQVRADLNPLRSLRTTLTLRNINPTFSSIQTPGFGRNERAMEFSSVYTPFKNLNWSFNWQKSQRPSYSSGFGVNQFTVSTNGSDNYDQYSTNLVYTLSKGGSISLSRSDLSTRFAIGGKSANTTDTLAFNYGLETKHLGSVNLDLSLSRNKSNTSTFYDLGNGLQSIGSDTSTLSKRLGLSWNPRKWLNLSGSISDNAIRGLTNSGTTRSNARDSNFTARLTPNANLTLSYSYNLSDTGNLSNLFVTNTTTGGTTGTVGGTTGGGTGGATRSVWPFPVLWPTFGRTRDVLAGGTTGTTTGATGSYGSLFGGGYNYNLGGYGNYSGFYGGNINNGYGVSSFGGRSAAHRLGIEYLIPKRNINLGLTVDRASSIGDYQYNSNRNGLSFILGWQPSDRMRFDFNYALSRIAYTGSLGGSNTNNISIGLSGRPFGGKLNMQLGWTNMRSSSNLNFSSVLGNTTGTPVVPTDTGLNLSSLSVKLDYPIGNRYSLFAEMLNSTGSGYQSSSEGDLRFGLNYAITREMGFQLGWQILSRNYSDPQYATYNYKVSTLLAEIGFNFR